MLTRFHSTRRLILILRFHLKNVFVSRLGVIYCYFWIFRVLGTSWFDWPILFECRSNETGKIVLLL